MKAVIHVLGLVLHGQEVMVEAWTVCAIDMSDGVKDGVTDCGGETMPSPRIKIYMMKIKMRLGVAVICAVVVMLAPSCRRDAADDKHFAVEKDLKAEYVDISELLQINNIFMLEDYLVLQNTSEAVDDFFFVYSYPEMDFLYSFAKRGRGPGEYMMPGLIKNTKGNILGLRDHATDILAFYEITGSGAVPAGSSRFSSPDNDRFFWEINSMGDSLFLVKHQGDRRGATELWDYARGRVVDSIPNTFDRLPKKLGRGYYTIFDDYMVSANGNRFAVAYFMIDRIETGEVSAGEIIRISDIGSSTAPDFYLYGKNETDHFNVDRNIVYYENLYAGKNSIYALYSHDRLDNTEKNHSRQMEVYSWELEPLMKLHLEYPVAYFTVDESSRIIYGVNPELFPDKLLVYKY